jgi:hypothetical protein
MALGYAGVALAVLALMLPALLVMKSRKQHPDAAWRVAGGSAALWLVLLCGIGIVAISLRLSQACCPRWGKKKGPIGPFFYFAKQHCLYFLPLPHGQGIVAPHLRLISDGLLNFRRLRVLSPVVIKRQGGRTNSLNAGDKLFRG